MSAEESPAKSLGGATKESRTRSLGRSRSRGRNNPNELLARKQQLLSDSVWRGEDEPTSGGRSPRSRATRTAGMSGTSAAEEKLENLSELLQAHQTSEFSGGNPQSGTPTSQMKSIDDVYILLAKKEKDLQLAAELGKVLLEKNEELSKANERITEEYSHKLELLEQDKHKLKRKLDLLDADYENRLIELQTDCNILKNQLEDQQQLARQTEKEKSKLIDDLVQQNQRLTSELVEATKSEELLSSQLEQLNERFNVRLSNRQDHVVQLDALKEEISIVNQRKQDLERRLKVAQSEKGSLSAALEESGDKLLLMENLLNEKDSKLVELLDEVHELRDSSSWLSSELESMINLNEKLAPEAMDTSTTAHQSLLMTSQRKRSQLVDQLKELRLKCQSRMKASEFMLLSRRNNKTRTQTARTARSSRFRRTNKPLEEIVNKSSNRSSTSNGSSQRDSDEEEDSFDEQQWNESAASEIFNLLRRFHSNLQQRRDCLSSPNGQTMQLYSPNSACDDSGISADDSKFSNMLSKRSIDNPANSSSDRSSVDKNGEQESLASSLDPSAWKRLLTSLKLLIEEMPCQSCHLMIAERTDYEQLRKLHSRVCEELRRKSDELLAVSAAKLELDAKVGQLEERCNTLSNDLSNCDKPKEEIVKLAWKARDEAVERKNGAEISLAKTRVENMQISSQLMEVVQQKGELSQKLAQFEDDIHYMTQDSVKAKFTWEEYAEKLRRSKTAQSDSNTNLNPLVQLLSFSVASSKETNGTSKSSAMDNLNQPASLVRNFTSNRFNLRFWQRSSSGEKTADKGTGSVSNTNNNTTSLSEQKAS